MFVGTGFGEFYAGAALAGDMRVDWWPWLLDGCGPDGGPPVDLGDSVLDLGPGASVQLPAERVPAAHPSALPEGGDPTALPWPDGTFSAVCAVLALHHLPDDGHQDAALAECARVLRPGGMLVGLNPIDGPHFRSLDLERRCRAIDPLTFSTRLRAAGFATAVVRVWSLVAFRAATAAEGHR